jgi:hypothetical protein
MVASLLLLLLFVAEEKNRQREEEQQWNGRGRQQAKRSIYHFNTRTPTPWHSLARRESHAAARLRSWSATTCKTSDSKPKEAAILLQTFL